MRQNETAEMPATMKKMKMDTAAAKPYCAPCPDENASLYVYEMRMSVDPAMLCSTP